MAYAIVVSATGLSHEGWNLQSEWPASSSRSIQDEPPIVPPRVRRGRPRDDRHRGVSRPGGSSRQNPRIDGLRGGLRGEGQGRRGLAGCAQGTVANDGGPGQGDRDDQGGSGRDADLYLSDVRGFRDLRWVARCRPRAVVVPRPRSETGQARKAGGRWRRAQALRGDPARPGGPRGEGVRQVPPARHDHEPDRTQRPRGDPQSEPGVGRRRGQGGSRSSSIRSRFPIR
jgi:hypothetical protein